MSGGFSASQSRGKVDRAFHRSIGKTARMAPSRRFTQLAASIGLSALFLIVYGWCNWFTAHRANVPTLFFEWERSIPFVPLMIAPYISIHLFFVAAPFLCLHGLCL